MFHFRLKAIDNKMLIVMDFYVGLMNIHVNHSVTFSLWGGKLCWSAGISSVCEHWTYKHLPNFNFCFNVRKIKIDKLKKNVKMKNIQKAQFLGKMNESTNFYHKLHCSSVVVSVFFFCVFKCRTYKTEIIIIERIFLRVVSFHNFFHLFWIHHSSNE